MKIVSDVEELEELKEIFKHGKELRERWEKCVKGCKYKRKPKVISIPASLPECTKTNLSCIYYFCPLMPENREDIERVKREMKRIESELP